MPDNRLICKEFLDRQLRGTRAVAKAGFGYGREPSERQSSFLCEAPGPEIGQEVCPGTWILSSDVVPSGTRFCLKIMPGLEDT